MTAATAPAAIQPLSQRIETLTGLSYATVVGIALLVVGWLVAYILSRVLERGILRVGRMLPGSDTASDSERSRVARWVSRVVFWVVVLGFVLAATELLGLPLVTTWVSGVAAWLPRLLVSLLVLVGGIFVGRLTRTAVARAASSAGISYAQRLGRLSQLAVVSATVLVAIEQLGVEVGFVTTALMIVLAATLGGAALAFGMGSRGVMENILAGHYVRQLYDVGQVVRIDGVQGRVLRLTATAVVLQTDEGEAVIPAQEFTHSRSTRISEGRTT